MRTLCPVRVAQSIRTLRLPRNKGVRQLPVSHKSGNAKVQKGDPLLLYTRKS